MNRTFITGDTHGDFSRLSHKNWKEGKELDKTDVVIVLGDFGIIWSLQEDKTEIYWKKFLNERNFTVVFVPGNHENYDRLFSTEFNKLNKFNNELLEISENIFMLQRGFDYEINGKKFLAVGGATSVDKPERLHHITWWPQEDFTYKEYVDMMNRIDGNNKFDYVITHTAPVPTIIEMGFKNTDMFPCPTSNTLTELVKVIEFDKWFFGHFHLDNWKSKCGKYECKFKGIKEL